ncbi:MULTISPECIES: paeninodin family lasso peptide [Paenibacillus]|nr:MULTISPECIES: paeninodin family lasso peptide [Paenibacillus]MCK9860371.1 paeninodin family lasso peptide [Paenibacillus sp. ATY16]
MKKVWEAPTLEVLDVKMTFDGDVEVNSITTFHGSHRQ